MINEFSIKIQFFIYSLAIWRLTHLFTAEDGPWDIVYILRKKLVNSVAGNAMDCFYCLSIWMALPFALFISTNWVTKFIFWLALSGAACLLNQLNNHHSS